LANYALPHNIEIKGYIESNSKQNININNIVNLNFIRIHS